MEKRAEPRFQANQEVHVTLLDGSASELPARIVNISGTGMRLEIDRTVKAGTPIQIDWDQTLLLGEVCYCERTPSQYAIGVELEHALLQTGDLARLSRKLLGEEEAFSRRSESAEAPVHRDKQHE